MSNHKHLNEQNKYQVLLGYLKLLSPLKLGKAYMHDPKPYTRVLQTLQEKYSLYKVS